MASFASTKERYISRTQMTIAGLANKPRQAEPSLWNLLGWERDAPPAAATRQQAPALANVSEEEKDNNKAWESESRSSYSYYAKIGTVRRQFKNPVDPDAKPTTEVRRRFSLIAEEAANRAIVAAVDEALSDTIAAAVAAGNSEDAGGETKTGKSRRSTKGRGGSSKTGATGGSKKPLKKRRKKKRAPKSEGPKAKFFTYGMGNTHDFVNKLQTHNVMPDDPREIYPNALHAAVRHPNAEKAARAIKKAEFLKSHQDSVSVAAEELLKQLAKDAQVARKEMKTMSIRQQAAAEQKDKEELESKEPQPVVRKNQISNPLTDPNLTMWDLMSWPGSTNPKEIAAASSSSADADAADAADAAADVVPVSRKNARKKTDLLPTRATKVATSQILFVDRPVGKGTSPERRRKRITIKANGLKKVTIDEIEAYEKFEPQTIEMVDPKKFSGLSPAWTRNIPTAGKKSPARQRIPL